MQDVTNAGERDYTGSIPLILHYITVAPYSASEFEHLVATAQHLKTRKTGFPFN